MAFKIRNKSKGYIFLGRSSYTELGQVFVVALAGFVLSEDRRRREPSSELSGISCPGPFGWGLAVEHQAKAGPCRKLLLARALSVWLRGYATTLATTTFAAAAATSTAVVPAPWTWGGAVASPGEGEGLKVKRVKIEAVPAVGPTVGPIVSTGE